ncbi:replication initiator protein [Blackfly microvirus SF02]|uniref:Replication initiator protein n=1 Tax=Blackfly microvirus SF02 TaxID=2576452 RepID=A0A4P8PK73_9VIRU|nr:replication initiator protein [Blackfly microvirus SF02]
MVCFAPLTAYRPPEGSEDGRLVFNRRVCLSGIPIRVPCSKCVGCMMVRRRQWAVRCMHEKRMHSASAFVTLTYDDDHLPPGGFLVKRDLQLFMKRLRKQRPTGLRFFACGEYGERTLRPHFHVLLLNTDFADGRFYKASASGSDLFTSRELSSLWPDGHCDFGAVTFGSAAYVAGYVMKKAVVPVLLGLPSPFVVMSRRPGIGTSWFERYSDEAYKHDSAIMKGREVPLPRFYDGKFETLDPDRNIFGDSKRLARLKRLRRVRARLHPEELSLRRLRVRELVEQRKVELFAREF